MKRHDERAHFCNIFFKLSSAAHSTHRPAAAGQLTFIAEEAGPSLLTVALPRLGAVAVHAARVREARVAVVSVPSHTASVNTGDGRSGEARGVCYVRERPPQKT